MTSCSCQRCLKPAPMQTNGWYHTSLRLALYSFTLWDWHSCLIHTHAHCWELRACVIHSLSPPIFFLPCPGIQTGNLEGWDQFQLTDSVLIMRPLIIEAVIAERLPLAFSLFLLKYARSNLYLPFHTFSFITLHYLVMNRSLLFLLTAPPPPPSSSSLPPLC